jgi:hypothetical protein
VNPIGFFIVAIGLFAIAGGLRDWPWFWNSSRARFVTTILTRAGARVFYVAMGIVSMVCGVWAAVADM